VEVIQYNPFETWLAPFTGILKPVTFNPKLTKDNCQYQIIRGCTHDGTLLFRKDTISRALDPIIKGYSYCKSDGEDVIVTGYEIGLLTLVTEYLEKADLPCGKVPGCSDTVFLPVRTAHRKEVSDGFRSAAKDTGDISRSVH